MEKKLQKSPKFPAIIRFTAKQYSFTQTAATVREALLAMSSNIEKMFEVSAGVLLSLEDPKPEYRIGFLYKLTNRITGRVETIGYYPMKQAFVSSLKPRRSFPRGKKIAEESGTIDTKFGMMQIVEIDERNFGVSFRTFAEVIE